MESRTKEHKRRVAKGLWRVTIGFAGIGALSFVLSCIPKLSEFAWLRPLSEIAGACDGIAFFGLMYWQLANDRAELLEPTKDIVDENGVLLVGLGKEVAKFTGMHEELGRIHEQLLHVANTQRLTDAAAYMGRLSSEINGAVISPPRHPTPVLRLMRLSGHWRMNERLERTANLLAKFFHPGDAAGQWSDQWEVQVLYAVADRESLDSLLNKKAGLGRVIAEHPKNFTFRLIARRQFEPSIGLATISDDVAFVAFDESTDDPFPEEGLEIRGDAVGWYLTWFDEMFESSCALKIYERGKIYDTEIANLRKALLPSTGKN